METLEAIAANILGLDTLETRGGDDADFTELAVWQIKEALQAAYAAGESQA